MTENQYDDISLCENCTNLLHYCYDREVSLSCKKGHEPRLYPPIVECNDHNINGRRL